MKKELTTQPDLQSALLQVVQREDIDPERLEKFLDIHFRIRDDQAGKAFNQAMVKFQKACPIITKTKHIKGKGGQIRSSYAPLDELIHQIKKLLVKNGLSYSFDVELVNDSLQNIVVTIRHIDGFHKNFNYPYEPMDEGGLMNNQQRRKSALSYGKRAALENALGIVTQGEDDDAQRAVGNYATEDQMEELGLLSKDMEIDEEKFKSFIGAKSLENLTEAQAKKAIQALKQKRIASVQSK